jgi:hypothetical protein
MKPRLGRTMARFARTAASASCGVILVVAIRYAMTTVALLLMPMKQCTYFVDCQPPDTDVAEVRTYQNAIVRTLCEGVAYERRRYRKVGKDVLIGIVGHRDVQCSQRECGWKRWGVLDDRNEVGDSKVG